MYSSSGYVLNAVRLGRAPVSSGGARALGIETERVSNGALSQVLRPPWPISSQEQGVLNGLQHEVATILLWFSIWKPFKFAHFGLPTRFVHCEHLSSACTAFVGMSFYLG